MRRFRKALYTMRSLFTLSVCLPLVFSLGCNQAVSPTGPSVTGPRVSEFTAPAPHEDVPCAVALSTTAETVPSGGAAGRAIAVTLKAGDDSSVCTWTSTSDSQWLRLDVAFGIGDGNLIYTAEANLTPTGRIGNILVTVPGNNIVLTVIQSSAGGVFLTLSPGILDFGEVAAGDASTASLTVTNYGEADTVIHGMDDCPDRGFTVLNNNQDILLSRDGGAVFYTVEFRPRSEGYVDCLARLRTGDATVEQQVAMFTGTGVPPPPGLSS